MGGRYWSSEADRLAAALIEPSLAARRNDTRRFGYPCEQAYVIPPGVDTERFDPARAVVDMRGALGFGEDVFVVGIIARMQPYRRHGDFLEAFRLLGEAVPEARALVVGRGEAREDIEEHARGLGLGARAVFAGQHYGDRYVGMLKAFDSLVYLMPGSDGTCRTVREAMAMGTPVVAADRGDQLEPVHLRHLQVGDDKVGQVLPDLREGLDAVGGLLDHPAGAEQLAHHRAVHGRIVDNQYGGHSSIPPDADRPA